MIKLNYDKERVARAKDLRLRWYKGEKVERVPFVYTVSSKKSGAWLGNPYNFKEMLSDSAIAVEGALIGLQHQFDTFPDCDFLPAFRMFYTGQGILASMYGAKQYIVENQPPFTEGRPYKDIYETQQLDNNFEIEDTEWGKLLKEHVVRFVEATEGMIPVEVADYQSPYGTATKIIPNEELMLAMFDEPEMTHRFLGLVTDGIIKLVEAMERWVGKDLLTKNVQNPVPGECGITLWDDYVSVITPELHTEFCAPCNRKLYDRFGYGHLHTCGPYFPGYIDACLACEPRSMDVTIMRGMTKTRSDLIAFLETTRKRNMRLFGGLAINDKSIFEKGGRAADNELLEMFIRGGFMPSSGGDYKKGLEFKEFIERIEL